MSKPNNILAQQISESLAQFAKAMENGTADPAKAKKTFDLMLAHVSWNARSVMRLADLERSFTSHLHVGSFRKLPNADISKRSLPVTSETTPWLKLIDYNDELLESEQPQEIVNRSLVKLKIPYQVATRLLKVIAYKPIRKDGQNSKLLVQELEFTEEELVFHDRFGASHPIRSLGSGIGVILPVIVALATAESELLSIEEPESHVHPKLQTELGDIVIESASGNRQKTLFIETHSEHLILRILRRIRETTRGKLPEGMPEITPDKIAVLYVEPGEGGSVIQEIKIDEQGRIRSKWPKGFFEERLEELF
jgi:hypothetical protein